MIDGAAHVLVVDDRPENLIAMRAALEDPRLVVDTADSGPSALRHLLEHHYSAVLLDVAMPVMNGFEVASLIRKRERDQAMPILMITAFATDPSLVQRGFASGASDYLPKPVDPSLVLAKTIALIDVYSTGERYVRALETAAQERAQLERQITELRQLVALQNEAHRELEFTARMPLTALKLRAQRALKSPALADHPNLLRELLIIDDQIDRLAEIIEDAGDRWAVR